MDRREALQAIIAALASAGTLRAGPKDASVKAVSLRGKLVKDPAGKPALQTGDGKIVSLHGDDPTLGVLQDERLTGADFEALGHFTDSGRFEVNPIHEQAIWVHKEDKRLLITYWCPVCHIRTYTPGPCWCCQRYTDLDLRESLDQ